MYDIAQGASGLAYALDVAYHLILPAGTLALIYLCLLYTSDAADERSSVDLGGRRLIKTKNREY